MTPGTADRDTAAREALRSVGLRVTAPRRAVLIWLFDHKHSSVQEIADVVRHQLGSVSTQTVYDVLDACTRAGLLRRIELAGHPARFEWRAGDNHHHLVCRSCGRTTDVDCVTAQRPCLSVTEDHGYDIEEAEVVFWGRCPACTSTPRTSTASATNGR